MARQVAEGTEFFRTLVFMEDGHQYAVLGPYSTKGIARAQGTSSTTRHGYGQRMDWTFKIQELKPIVHDTFYGDGDDAHLEWVDVV